MHETVVNTLRRERDNLSTALANQRESANSLASKLTQLGIVNAQLEHDNVDLMQVQNEDQKALQGLHAQYEASQRENEA